MSLHIPREIEKGRVRTGATRSAPSLRSRASKSYGSNGHFVVRCPGRAELQLIVSDGEGWEHVSVSARNRCPVWEEMAWVKDMLWDEEDTVVQYHPPKSDYVNSRPFVLHLWRPLNVEVPLPPFWMVGPKSARTDNRGFGHTQSIMANQRAGGNDD